MTSIRLFLGFLIVELQFLLKSQYYKYTIIQQKQKYADNSALLQYIQNLFPFEKVNFVESYNLKMQPQSNSKSISQASSFKSFPPCINKKEARMVCLNEECKDYAFFCLLCEDQSCESIHRHINKADKLEAIGFKEFIRRVLKQKKPVEELETAISSYRQTLLKLKEVVNQFVQRELKRITDIHQKTTEVPEDVFPTIKKLKQQQYQGLMGNQMDYLWKNCGETQQSIQSQHQTASFLHENEQAVKELTQAFEKMNKWEIERAEKKEGQYGSPNNRAPTQSNSYPQSNNNTSGNRRGYQT